MQILQTYNANVGQVLCKYSTNIAKYLHILDEYWTYVLQISYKIMCVYCINVVEIEFKYEANVIQILCKYCTNIVQILCKYFINILQILHRYCVNIVYYEYFANIV